MKVYELMSELATFPSGAVVKVRAAKDSSEMEILEENKDITTYIINYEVQEATYDDNCGEVEFDIY